ncbi:MAG: DDE-type integrase/transposase/recombinase [candidate division WOR-3 bacterium]
MKIFKNIKNLEVYKFGLISPVLHGREDKQNQYFSKLSEEGVEIPPGSGNVYYLKPTTFKRWLRKFKDEGLEGLKAKIRSDKGKYRKITPAVLKAIEKINKDTGAVSVSDLYRKLIINGHVTPSDLSLETLRKLVIDNDLLKKIKDRKQRKKFEKAFFNELWMVDFKEGKSVRHGKTLRRTYFCGIIDDASRVLVGYEWGFYQDTTLFAKTFKKAVLIYGIPKILYCDQAKVFRSHYIMQICARLGISLVNAPPYSPESKAKIERFNRTIQQMFYPLIKDFHAIDIDQLNQLFDKFIREIYHLKPHAGLEKSESPMKKLQRLLGETKIQRINDEQLEQFFLCSMKRKVRLDGTITVKNIYYEVDMKYAGEFVEVRFPVDNPNRLFLFDSNNDRLCKELKPADLVRNANPPHVSTSYSKLSSFPKNENEK